jgi:hypothetical protein
MGCAGCVARIGEMRNPYKFLVEKPENVLGDLGRDWNIILK